MHRLRSRAVGLAAFIFSVGFAVAAPADIQVLKQHPRGSTKINATEREYRYQVIVQNNGAAATNITATLTSYSDQITIVSGNLQFPDMAPGEIAASLNEFVVRRPKTFKVNKPKALRPNGPLLRIDFNATSMPVANAGADQVRGIGAATLLNGRSSFDPFGKPLTYLWSLQSAPGGSAATISNPDTVLATFTPDVAGDYVFSLTVSNGTNTSAASTTTVSTDAVRPVADAGRDQIVKKRSIVQLDGSASTNLMERPLTYAWQILSAPEGSRAALSDPTALRPTFVADRRGTYRIQLVVTDGPLPSMPSVVTVARGTSRTNTPPRADAGFDIPSYGPTLPVILQGGRSTDVDGDFLTYRWSVLGRPAGSAAAPDASDPHPIFRLDGAGAWHLQVSVSDGQSESVATVLVNTDNDVAPRSAGYVVPDDSDPAKFAVDGESRSNYVTLNGDPGSLTRSWTLLSRPNGSAASLGPVSPACHVATPYGIQNLCRNLQTDGNGDYAVQLKTTDRGSVTTLQGLGITRGPARPVAVVDATSSLPKKGSAIHFVTWVPNLAVTIDGSHSFDQNGLPLSYRWTLLHRPTNSHATLSDPTVASPTITMDQDGRYVAQLVVNNGLSDSLPVTTTLVNYDNSGSIAADLLTAGPWMSPCIPLTLRGQDRESAPSTYDVGVVFRVINSTLDGTLTNFVDAHVEDAEAEFPVESTLCYRPRRFFSGIDAFSYETYDTGFPWMCGDEAPDCRTNKTSFPAFGTIDVIELP